LEYLDQFELLDAMTQEGFISRGSVNFDKDGARNVDRGWLSMFNHARESYFSWVLNLRLKYSEDIIRDHFIRQGGIYRDGLELTSFDHDGTATKEYHQAHIKDIRTNQSQVYERWETHRVLKVIHILVQPHADLFLSRFLIGADGASSTTRRLAQISTQSFGPVSPIKWVRMDAVVKTDMPDLSLGVASLESQRMATSCGWV
jgi:phenol 2-monooxygenase (NADPH)